MRRAFTLIELLIVVAIIAILAAIALPNFLEAQTRAKVARVKADHRTLVTALETYRISNNNYPISIVFATDLELLPLTTPVSYISSIPRDPFEAKDENGVPQPQQTYDYVRYILEKNPNRILRIAPPTNRSNFAHYVLISAGPDSRQEINYILADVPDWSFITNSYDATNGSVSKGDIYTFGSSGRLE